MIKHPSQNHMIRLVLLLVGAVTASTGYRNVQPGPIRLCNVSKVLTISFTTDQYPDDITWTLKNEHGGTILSMPTLYASGYKTPTNKG